MIIDGTQIILSISADSQLSGRYLSAAIVVYNSMKNKRFFITGGFGFIGSTLVRRLINDNEIMTYDNLFRNALGDDPATKHPNLTAVQGDVLDTQKLEQAIRDYRPTHIVHCAAIAGIDTVVQKPVSTIDINVTGTANLLRAANELNGLERVVLFSTSEVFGTHAFQSSEITSAVIGAVGEARWTYAVSKLVCEHLGHAYFHQYGMPVTVVRPFNVYGPGQVGEGALSTFIKRALSSEDLIIHGDGSQIRAWCYVDDMVEGVYSVLQHPNAVGESFNIGNAKAVTTIYGLASTVIRLIGSRSNIIFQEKTHADIELRVPDVKKARDLLDYEANIDLEDGIPRTAVYYKEKLSL